MSLVTAGKNAIAGLITGTGTNFGTANAYLGVGDSTAATTVGMTDLQAATNKFRKAVTSSTTSGLVITATATLASGEGNFSLQEFGLFNAASGGTMLSRLAQDHGSKVAGDTATITYTLTLS